MKILLAHDSGAHLFDRLGFQRVLNFCGHQATIWNIKEKPAFDAFEETQPEIFWGQVHNLDRATMKCLLKRPIKVALKAGHWGDVDRDVDQKKYPVLMASDEHKRQAQFLKDNNRLDFVFVHYHPSDIQYTMGGWNSIVKPVGILNGFDNLIYSGGKVLKEFETDLSFIGGSWAYKNQMLSKYLYPLCNPIGKFKIRIYGNSIHGVGQYLGPIQEENSRHMFVSSKINVDVAEPHAYDFKFDISEKLFKVTGAGGFYLSLGKVLAQQETLFPNGLLKYTNLSTNEEDIRYWLNNNEEREQNKKELHEEIVKNHTYFERVSQMFSEFGLEEESKQILEKKNDSRFI